MYQHQGSEYRRVDYIPGSPGINIHIPLRGPISQSPACRASAERQHHAFGNPLRRFGYGKLCSFVCLCESKSTAQRQGETSSDKMPLLLEQCLLVTTCPLFPGVLINMIGCKLGALTIFRASSSYKMPGLRVTSRRASPNNAVTERLQYMPPVSTTPTYRKRSTAQPTNTTIMLNTNQLPLPPNQISIMSSHYATSVGASSEHTSLSTLNAGPKAARPWGRREVRVLTSLWQNGLDPKHISRMLNRSEMSVKSKLTRLGLPYTIGARPRESAFSVKKTLNAGNLRTLEQRQRDRIAVWSGSVEEPAPARSQSSGSSQISDASTLVADSETASDTSSATTVVASVPVSPEAMVDKPAPVPGLPVTTTKTSAEATTPSLAIRMNANAAAFNFNADPKACPTPISYTKVSPAPSVSNYTPQSPVFDDALVSPPRLGRLPSYTRAFMSKKILAEQDQDLPASARVYGREQVSHSAVSLRRCGPTFRSPKALAAVGAC
jgi:hypothetical protein